VRYFEGVLDGTELAATSDRTTKTLFAEASGPKNVVDGRMSKPGF
jgi:hypothetical protein